MRPRRLPPPVYPRRKRGCAGRNDSILVVHYDVSQVDIAAHRMNEMVAANSVTIAVAAGANHFQLVVANSHAGRNRQRAAVQRVHAVSVDVTRQIR